MSLTTASQKHRNISKFWASAPIIVNGAIALVLFIGAPMASIVQFIVQLLSPTQLQTVQNITTVINLIMPTDALWHATSFYLLPPAAIFASIDSLTKNSMLTIIISYCDIIAIDLRLC